MNLAPGPRTRSALLVTLLFIVLTAAMTWPQVEYLATRSRQHQDVFFNLWRLRWLAHALASSPSHLFDGNIFHPELRTLTFSDAMLVEGLAGAPLLWLGRATAARPQPAAPRSDRRLSGWHVGASSGC